MCRPLTLLEELASLQSIPLLRELWQSLSLKGEHALGCLLLAAMRATVLEGVAGRGRAPQTVAV